LNQNDLKHMKRFIVKFCVAAVAAVCVECRSHAALVTESTSASVAIPDNSPDVGAASDIYIAPTDLQLGGIVNPSVASMSLTFTITGGWDGDYTLVLKHVDADGLSSQSSTLFTSLLSGGAANSGFTSVTLSSATGTDTAVPSSSSTAAITGTMFGINFTPFQGVAPTGDWILYATDNAGGFNGTLSGWTLNLDVVPEPVNVALAIFGVGISGVGAVQHIITVQRQRISARQATQ